MIGAETKPFGFFADRARARGWDSRSQDTGHEVMITAPEILARLLVELPVPSVA